MVPVHDFTTVMVFESIKSNILVLHFESINHIFDYNGIPYDR